MAKPLWRWTVGSCLPQGLEILVESITRTTKVLGVNKWDWVVCYNGLNQDELNYVTSRVSNLPVQFVPQNWATCPIQDYMQSPRRKDGSFEWNGNRCGGTLWKVCPARMRMESHEVVMDNDIVILRPFDEIEMWLSQRTKSLILEEPIRFYGRYDCLFGGQNVFLNSGLMGFPPEYDFGAEIFKNWVKHGRYMNLSQADEQGLLTYTLSQIPSIRIKKEQMFEFLGRDYGSKVTGTEQAIHFTQANRIPNHRGWLQYQEIIGKNIV